MKNLNFAIIWFVITLLVLLFLDKLNIISIALASVFWLLPQFKRF